jgi:short subunit dehydrogenase-like uncharacterized protein
MQGSKHKIVVIGSYGDFTRRVTTDLSAMPQVACVLGLPPAPGATTFAGQLGVPFMVLDPNEPASLQRLLEGAFAVVNLCGPFQSREDLAIATRCATHGVHYIDPADSREYVTEFLRLAKDARDSQALLVTGAGAAPAVTAALAGTLTREFTRASEIHVFVTPGMTDQRELASVRSILEHAEKPSRQKERGRGRKDATNAPVDTVQFPKPVGRRRGWLCDLPDVELLPRHFGVGTVTARVGFAPGLLSFVVGVLARRSKPLSGMAAWLVRRAAAMKRSDGACASVRVAMRGTRRSAEEEHVVYLIARDGAGPAIAAAPILALVRRWVEQGVNETGALSSVGLLTFDDLKPELVRHDITLVKE